MFLKIDILMGIAQFLQSDNVRKLAVDKMDDNGRQFMLLKIDGDPKNSNTSRIVPKLYLTIQ